MEHLRSEVCDQLKKTLNCKPNLPYCNLPYEEQKAIKGLSRKDNETIDLITLIMPTNFLRF